MASEESNLLQYTPTWLVAAIFFVVVLMSLIAERGLDLLGKCLKLKKGDALFEALQKVKELVLLGFISLVLTVFKGLVSKICIPTYNVSTMLPCKHQAKTSLPIINRRRLFSTDYCSRQGKVPLLSLEELLYQLQIFINVLAVVHTIYCLIAMVFGSARVRQWKRWEHLIHRNEEAYHHRLFFIEQAQGHWRKTAIVSWTRSFFKQFHGSVTRSDYMALRRWFIMAHMPHYPRFDFHKYLMRTLEVDFRKVLGISWYLWLFVAMFLLLDVQGWHTYFWLSFLPLVLLLVVGAKLEHIIIQLAQNAYDQMIEQGLPDRVQPSDEHFWFKSPTLVFNLIHFILFQSAFELAFFFWILCTYGFHSCIMEKMGYIIPILIMSVITQVLCGYITLPLYVLVTKMGSKLREGMFDPQIESIMAHWRRRASEMGSSTLSETNF